MNLKICLIGLTLFVGVLSACPAEIIAPCFCRNEAIVCNGENVTDWTLDRVFHGLDLHLGNDQKYFPAITISGTNLTKLAQNVFYGLTFGEIMIMSNQKLRKIDPHAFGQTEFTTKSISFLSNDGLSENADVFFNILSRFVNLEKIYIDRNGVNITEIPDNAFKPINGYQNYLKSIQIMRMPITKIGSRAFYYLNNLEQLNFFRVDFNHISDYAFEFQINSTRTLTLNLDWSYKLRPGSFEPNSLRSIRRPTNITMKYQSSYDFPYLDKDVFLPFFLENEHSYLEYVQVKIDCTDCRNAWLKQYSKVIKKNFEWMCDWATGINFDDPDTFAKCKE